MKPNAHARVPGLVLDLTVEDPEPPSHAIATVAECSKSLRLALAARSALASGPRHASSRSRRTRSNRTTRPSLALAGSSSGSAKPSSGSRRRGSSTALPESDPEPPGRLRVGHSYVVDTADSVVDGFQALMGVAA